MSLYKRGNTWHYDFAIAGRRYRGSTRQTVFSRARKMESILMAEARDRGNTLLDKRAPDLRDFVQRFFHWVDSSQLEPSTRRYYRTGWNLIQKTRLKCMRLDHITTDEVGAERLGSSPSNANCGLRTLRRMLGKAAEWGVIRSAPQIKLLKERGRSALMDSITEEKLLAVSNQPLKDVLLIMLDTGMRPSEVFRMRWEDVNWERHAIFIPHGKTKNSRRYVPLSERVKYALLERSSGRTEGWIFPACSQSGHLETVQQQFAEARKTSGISHRIVLYSARHTFATQALASTGNLAAVMKALGHSNAQTAMIYQHPGIESIRLAVNEKNEAGLQRHNSRHSPSLLQ